MVFKRLLCFFAVCAFSLAVQPESWFLASSSELNQLETLWKTSEANRENWESQVRVLKNKAEILKKNSALLNSQLKMERETTQDLRKSFEEFAIGESRIIAQKESDLLRLKASLERSQAQRNILLLIDGILIFGGFGVLVLRKKPP